MATQSPTVSPSYGPTAAPSWSFTPTRSPSISTPPTVSPTQEPTFAPTNKPTTTPAPSRMPTISQRPTNKGLPVPQLYIAPGPLAGIVVGGIAGLILMATIPYFICRRYIRPRKEYLQAKTMYWREGENNPEPVQSLRPPPQSPIEQEDYDHGLGEEEEEESETPHVSRLNVRPPMPINAPEDMPALRIYHPGARSRDQDWI